MNKRIFIFFCMVFLKSIVFGQPNPIAPNLPIIIPPSPNARQFTKYGEYPVSHFTGVPQISIPLYTIRSRDIEVPISLSYHASGIKPNDQDGIISAGWTLHYGGLISQTVYDRDDDDAIRMLPLPLTDSIELLRHHYNTPTFVRYNNLVNALKNSDHHPDVYSYSFLGYHGKFIFKDGEYIQPMLLDHNSLLLKANRSSGTSFGFELKDEHGKKFEFGDASIGSGGFRVPNEWHLRTIISGIDTTKEIDYKYDSYHEVQTTRYDMYTLDDAESREMVSRWVVCHVNIPIENFMDNADGTMNTGGGYDTYYQSRVPTEINFDGGKVLFTYLRNPNNNRIIRLKFIEIYDFNNTLVKKIEFVITNPTSPIGYNFRPFLKELRFIDPAGAVAEKYAFNYIGEDYSTYVPIGIHAGVDYWGYYNKNLGWSDDIIPPTNVETHNLVSNQWEDIGTGDRKTNEQLMKIYTLNEIIYPTGGKTVFEYEANRFNGTIPNYSQPQVGGLRIKRITNYLPGNEFADGKEYEYVRDYMDVIPSDELFIHSDRYFIRAMHGEDWERFRRINIYSNPLINLAPHGSPVVYTNVREHHLIKNYMGTTPWLNNGYTDYHYDYTPFTYSVLQGNGIEGDSEGLYPLYKEYQHEFRANNDGKLIQVTQFDATHNPLESKNYVYDELPVDVSYGFVFDRYTMYIPDPCDPQTGENVDSWADGRHQLYGHPWNYGDVAFYSSVKRLASESSISNGVTTTVDYAYENPLHTFPTKTTSMNSKGEAFTRKLRYPHDFSGTQPYTNMVNRHNWSTVIEETLTKGLSQQIMKKKNNYNFWDGTAWTTSPSNLVVLKNIEESETAGLMSVRYLLNRYTSDGKILEQQQANGLKEVYLWGYNAQYPVAKIVGQKTYAEIISQSGIDTVQLRNPANDASLRSYLNALRSIGDVQVFTYTYKPLVGMTSETDPAGRITYYEYDSFGRLSKVKDDQDNIIKYICYNYAGQVINCNQ